MKQIAASCITLSLTLILSLASGRHIDTLCDNYIQQLTSAQQLAVQDDWSQARSITQAVYQDWNDRGFLFHALLRHNDTDQILLSFRNVSEYLHLEEMDQYCAANATLITQLELLAEMEQPTLKNVL